MAEDEAASTQWMFQYNPDWYDLEASAQVGLTEEWTMFHHRDYARVGQRIYFMRSGGQSGGQYAAITAVGRLASLVHEKLDETQPSLRYWVNVVYDSLVAPPLMRAEMRQDDVLGAYRPFAEGHLATVFRLTPEVAARTEQLVRGRLRPIGMSGVTVDKRIFVSHSHADNDFGVRLVHDLRRALGGKDETVWFDVSGGLHGGDAWWRTIVAELKVRPVFIVVVSPDALTSPWVADEIDLAWQLKNAPGSKLIVPVLYRACNVEEVRPDLATRQFVSFLPSRPYEEALHELLKTLGLSTHGTALAGHA